MVQGTHLDTGMHVYRENSGVPKEAKFADVFGTSSPYRPITTRPTPCPSRVRSRNIFWVTLCSSASTLKTHKEFRKAKTAVSCYANYRTAQSDLLQTSEKHTKLGKQTAKRQVLDLECFIASKFELDVRDSVCWCAYDRANRDVATPWSVNQKRRCSTSS